MSFRYKIGTELICIKDFYMKDGERSYTKGKYYKITCTNDYNIPDDFCYSHSMRDDSYIDQYFVLPRILKLKRLLDK